jgi:hypothetical protein
MEGDIQRPDLEVYFDKPSYAGTGFGRLDQGIFKGGVRSCLARHRLFLYVLAGARR